jgi:hypothetical protein
VLVYGWDFPIYNVSESSGTVELCVTVKTNAAVVTGLTVYQLVTANGTAICE